MLPQFLATCYPILKPRSNPLCQGAVFWDLHVDHAVGGACDRHVLAPAPSLDPSAICHVSRVLFCHWRASLVLLSCAAS